MGKMEKNLNYKYIESWKIKNLQCKECLKKESVKFTYEGKNYCNLCMINIILNKE